MSIPFIKISPDGSRKVVSIERPSAVENLAQDFLDAGGRYLIGGFLANPAASLDLIALINVKDGGAKDVARETSQNGPALLDAVDHLVAESVKHLPPSEIIPSARMRLGTAMFERRKSQIIRA
jgi:hypothetical protein